MRIFINGPVLDNITAALADFHDLTETAVEKVNLEIEGPAFHLIVKIFQVGIFNDFFVLSFPSKMFREQFGQGGLSGADVSGNGYMHNGLFLRQMLLELIIKNKL